MTTSRNRLAITYFLVFFLTTLAAAAKPNCQGTHQLFMQTCSMCHGMKGKGYASIHTPDFTKARWQAKHTDAQLIAAVTHGKMGAGRMPSFQGQLTPQQIDALVHCVVRGFGKKKK